MNPRDFLVLADELAADSTESHWRSAISRAYYAAFHVARELFRESGFRVPRADQAHSCLWLRLSNCGDSDVLRTGRSLRELRSTRNQADYDLHVAVDQREAIDAVQLATDTIKTLDDLLTLPTKVALIVSTIRTYEQTVLRQITWIP